MTENEFLRATTGSRPSGASLSALRGFSAPDSPVSNDGDGGGGGAEGKRKEDGLVLSSTTLWDFLVEHPLVRTQHVDMTDVCDRLRRLAKPGPHGPVFHEWQVREAIEKSRRGGGDTLI